MKVVYFYAEGDPEVVLEALKGFTQEIQTETIRVGSVEKTVTSTKVRPEHEQKQGKVFEESVHQEYPRERLYNPITEGLEDIKPAGKAEASPMSKQTDCTFCGRSTSGAGFLKRHQTHCKKNPDRIPHPKEGMPTPWLQTGRKK